MQHRHVVEEKEALERQHLPAVAQRSLREQPDLRQAVEHDPVRLDALDLRERHPDRLAEFQVGRVDERLLLLRIEAQLGRDELVDVEAVEGPAVALGHRQELALALGERDVEAPLAPAQAVEQELQAERGLPGAGPALHEMGAAGGIAAHQDVVETWNPRRNGLGIDDGQGRHSSLSTAIRSGPPLPCAAAAVERVRRPGRGRQARRERIRPRPLSAAAPAGTG